MKIAPEITKIISSALVIGALLYASNQTGNNMDLKKGYEVGYKQAITQQELDHKTYRVEIIRRDNQIDIVQILSFRNNQFTYKPMTTYANQSLDKLAKEEYDYNVLGTATLESATRIGEETQISELGIKHDENIKVRIVNQNW